MYDQDGRARDDLGRVVPSRINWVTLSRAVPGILRQFNQVVPASFWSQESEDEAVVACPCGEEPTVRCGSATVCACGRFYLNTGRSMRVFRPDDVEPGVPSVQEPTA